MITPPQLADKERIKILCRRFKALGVLGVLKSIRLNFKILPVRQAWRLPILVSGRTAFFGCARGSIKFDSERPKFGTLRIGLNDLEYSYDTATFIRIDGVMKINGKGCHSFGPGACLNVWKNATLEVGENFSCAPHLRLTATKGITIGSDNMWSFYNLVMDTDAHHIFNQDGDLINAPQTVTFGDHCWLGAYCKVLKGASIPGGSVVGSGSVVTKRLSYSDAIYLNNKVIREKISWDRKIL